MVRFFLFEKPDAADTENTALKRSALLSFTPDSSVCSSRLR